jgi:hypothetical protein
MFHAMKKIALLFVLILLSGESIFSQTQLQAKNFINISMKGVYKVQKELMKGSLNLNTNEAEFKKCVKYQYIAVKLYNQGKYADAVGYSYKSRVLAVEILDPIDKIAREKMKVTDEEKAFCDPAKYINLQITSQLLTSDDAKKIDGLNSTDHQEFRKLPLGIPIE